MATEEKLISSARYSLTPLWEPPARRTLLGILIDELDMLQWRSDYYFRPSSRAMRKAKYFIFHTYAQMRDAFPRPFFVLDGAKGIIINWAANGVTVRLNCLPNEGDEDYIYFENGDYDIEDNVTPDTLKDRLNWLTQHEREPAR